MSEDFGPDRKWPEGQVPYQLDNNFLVQTRSTVAQAMGELERCVR